MPPHDHNGPFKCWKDNRRRKIDNILLKRLMRNTIDGYIIYVKSMYITKHSNLEKEKVGISIKIIYHINIKGIIN